tara:strand:+ start:4778 stop:5680 length:903 start_codon:yes stop_codon:yes gene_type:complete
MKQDTNTNWYQGCKTTITGSELAKQRELKDMESKGIWIAQDKRDGWWACAHGGPSLTVINSKQNVVEAKNHGLHPFPAGCLVIGELAHGTQTGTDRKAELGHGILDVYDILFFNHEWLGDLPASERRKRLERWHRKLWKAAKPYYNLLEVWEDRFVERYKDATEGLVLKKVANGAYRPGEKVEDWVKVKKKITVDMVCMGWEKSTAATKTSVPMCKHIVAGLYINGTLVEVCRPGSINNATSIEVAADFEHNGGKKYLGQVLEVKGHAPRFRSGSLRHPDFGRWRPDKKATDCVWDPSNT